MFFLHSTSDSAFNVNDVISTRLPCKVIGFYDIGFYDKNGAKDMQNFLI